MVPKDLVERIEAILWGGAPAGQAVKAKIKQVSRQKNFQ
jgi:hypothetical protein